MQLFFLINYHSFFPPFSANLVIKRKQAVPIGKCEIVNLQLIAVSKGIIKKSVNNLKIIFIKTVKSVARVLNKELTVHLLEVPRSIFFRTLRYKGR